jgi:hypothetical protein
MMIKRLKYIVVYFFAAYFIVAGAGFNVVSYCCEPCAAEGIEAVATNSCFAVHHHNHISQNPQHEDLACDDSNHHPENCHLLRLNTDVPSFHLISKLLLKQLVITDLVVLNIVFQNEKRELFVQNNIPPPDVDVQKSGRSILAFHAVLLI